jgi:hypothetical protein
MLEKHQLKPLSDAVSDAWKNVNFANVNGIDVRLRVVTDRAANFTRTRIAMSFSAARRRRPFGCC